MYKTIEIDVDLDNFDDDDLYDELCDRNYVFPDKDEDDNDYDRYDCTITDKVHILLDAKLPYSMLESDIDALLKKYNIIYV